ncbi:small-conductance mechanosensitive channel [Pedobacter sp. CAN_A7]|uniref:mechanosensitive ion channel family protein n=1 Tax=Pedobacter sp. CAN_A7 TaxID=2787722 RepID=UPI0018C99964
MIDFNSFSGPLVRQSAENFGIALAAIIIGLLLKFILKKMFLFFSRYWATFTLNVVVKYLNTAVGFFIPLVLLDSSLEFMKLDATAYLQLNRALEIALTINFCIILIKTIKILEESFFHSYDLNKEDNLKERKLRTQLQFIRKFAISMILIVTAAIILLSFESMRKIGAGLLTGVGIGGIIIGFAAQKTLANLLAGFQIAFTQPIRIDDVVIVEGEWGRVEEITLTYVVVNIWDQRRLILPITYFIEKPFQNWTRVSADLLGTVFLYLDYNTPIPTLREELTKVLHVHPLWDKRVNVVQVTDNKEATIEVRFLMSARNSSQAFDLRCDVREHMLAFVRDHYPESLPKTRLEYKGNS